MCESQALFSSLATFWVLEAHRVLFFIWVIDGPGYFSEHIIYWDLNFVLDFLDVTVVAVPRVSLSVAMSPETKPTMFPLEGWEWARAARRTIRRGRGRRKNVLY
jgi:hypothetical protein